MRKNRVSYNMNRDYDATLGRYIESDPSGFNGGLNLFGYVAQQPTQLTDRRGLDNPFGPDISVGYPYANPAYYQISTVASALQATQAAPTSPPPIFVQKGSEATWNWLESTFLPPSFDTACDMVASYPCKFSGTLPGYFVCESGVSGVCYVGSKFWDKADQGLQQGQGNSCPDPNSSTSSNPMPLLQNFAMPPTGSQSFPSPSF